MQSLPLTLIAWLLVVARVELDTGDESTQVLDSDAVPTLDGLPAIRWAATHVAADLDGDGRVDTWRVADDGCERLQFSDGSWIELEDGRSAVLGLFADVTGDARAELLTLAPSGTVSLRSFPSLDGRGVSQRESPVARDESEGAIRLGVLEVDAEPTRLVLLDGRARARVFTLDRNARAELVVDLWWTPAGGHGSLAASAVPSTTEPIADPEGDRDSWSRPGHVHPSRGAASSRARREDSNAPQPEGPGGESAASTPGGGGRGPATALADPDTGALLCASSTPTLGHLYPNSASLFVAPTGEVGVGTTAPAERLHVTGGDVRVDGAFALGSPGAEVFLVRAGADEQPVVELRDGALRTTVALGESADGSETPRGFEIVDPATTDVVVAARPFPNLSLRDAITGQLGVVLEPALNLLSSGSSGVRFEAAPILSGGGGTIVIASLRDKTTPSRVELLDSSGGFGGPALRVFGNGELFLQREAKSSDGIEADMRVSLDDQIVLSTDRTAAAQPAAEDAGSLRLAGPSGFDSVLVDAATGDGDGRITLASGGDETLRLSGQGDFGRATLEVSVPGGPAVLRVSGTDGIGSSGSITTHDPGGTRAVVLDGDAGGGGLFSILSPPGVELVRLESGEGRIRFRRDDGSLALNYENGVLELANAAGVPTVTFDGENNLKTAVVPTARHGRRYLYAIESAEVWFEDSGSGALVDGATHIQLDPIYLETVTVGPEEPLIVHVTPTGPCRGLWVESDALGFTVRERSGGTSSAGFDWRVLGRARGREGIRLDPIEPRAPFSDDDREVH